MKSPRRSADSVIPPALRVRNGFTILLIVCVVCGCSALPISKSPTAAGLKPADLVDLSSQGSAGVPPPILRELYLQGEKVRESQRPAVVPPKRTVLVLSGGGSYGAYTAGVLCGWSETGTRPQFDVVTGVSTGALIAIFAFLGPQYDGELHRSYTTVSSKDIYRKKLLPCALFSDSLTDSQPLLQQIQSTVTPAVIDQIASAHSCGRRLYIGTTDLDGHRAVVWDLGAIASSGKPDRYELICKLLLASAAIPGFFPPVEIPVEIDGNWYVERHVDGGLTQPLFFRPPHFPVEQRQSSTMPELLFGSEEYIIVAGKLYADPQPVKPKIMQIIGDSLSTFLSAQNRDALVKLYMQSLLTGMQYNLAAMPGNFEGAKSAADFDRVAMNRMFEEGRRQSLTGTAWRHTPPGVEGGEEQRQRGGTSLTVVSRGAKTDENPNHLTPDHFNNSYPAPTTPFSPGHDQPLSPPEF